MLIVHMRHCTDVGITAMRHYSGVITGTVDTSPRRRARCVLPRRVRSARSRLASDNVVAPLAARSHSVIRFDRHRADRAQMPVDTEWSADASHLTAPRVPYVGRAVRLNACRKRPVVTHS